jgi:hypothetical protein
MVGFPLDVQARQRRRVFIVTPRATGNAGERRADARVAWFSVPARPLEPYKQYLSAQLQIDDRKSPVRRVTREMPRAGSNDVGLPIHWIINAPQKTRAYPP